MTENGIRYSHLAWIGSIVLSNISTCRSEVEWRGRAMEVLAVLVKAVPGQRKHSGVAESADIPACSDGVVGPLATSLVRFSDYHMGDCSSFVLNPFNTSFFLSVACLTVGPVESVQEHIHRQGLRRIGEPRTMKVLSEVSNIGRQQVGLVLQFRMQDRVRMR